MQDGTSKEWDLCLSTSTRREQSIYCWDRERKWRGRPQIQTMVIITTFELIVKEAPENELHLCLRLLQMTKTTSPGPKRRMWWWVSTRSMLKPNRNLPNGILSACIQCLHMYEGQTIMRPKSAPNRKPKRRWVGKNLLTAGQACWGRIMHLKLIGVVLMSCQDENGNRTSTGMRNRFPGQVSGNVECKHST